MKRSISLILALIMLLPVSLTGCKKAVYSDSSYIEYVSTVTGDGENDSEDDIYNTTGNQNTNESSSSSKNNTTSSGNKNNTTSGDKLPVEGNIGVTSTNEFKNVKITGVPSKLSKPQIKLLSWYDPGTDDKGTAFYWAIKKYEELYGKGTIQLTNTGTADTVKSKLAQSNAGGVNTAYDLVEIKTQWMPSMVSGSSKQIQPIDGLIDYKKLHFQDLVNSTSYDGKHYVGCPNGMWSALIWYNEKAFKKHGVTTPSEYYNSGNWTWTNFQKAAKEMYNKGYIGFSSEIIDVLLRSVKNGFCKYEGNKIVTNFNDPIVKEALQLMDTMIYTDKSWDPVLTTAKTTFSKGKIAMGCGTIGFPVEIAGTLKDDVTCVPLPRPNSASENYSSGYGIFWAIPSASGNVDGAVAFLKILAQYEEVDFGNRTPLERDLTDTELKISREQSEAASVNVFSSVTTFNDYQFWCDLTLKGSGKIESVLASYEPILKNAIDKMYK